VHVAETAHRLGITSKIQTDPSMALGAVEVSPLDMAQAYDAFANGGMRVHAYGIERIRTAAGQVLYDHGAEQPTREKVIDNPALGYMIQMMRQVIAAGTGGRAKIGGYDLAGKTGTTSDYKDAWFIGYTGGFTAAVWVGKDDDTPMRKVTGGGAPAEIWRNFMVAALPRLAAQAIPGGEPAPPQSDDAVGDVLQDGEAPPPNGDAEAPAEPQPPAPAGPAPPTPDPSPL
jgi:penicillin-binding protein 1A